MQNGYRSNEAKIEYNASGEVRNVAECATSDNAKIAADLLEKSRIENERRHYTKAARLMQDAERIDGFRWTE